MNPLMWLRVAGVALLMAGLYGGYQYIQHTGVVQGRAEVQAVFDKYKGDVNDQVEKANAKAAAIKAEQDAKYAKAQGDYATTRKQLNAALARLRNPQVVPGNQSVQVAGCGTGSMPAQAGDTGGTATGLKTYEGTASLDFYSDAMTDNLQCERLIEFVK